MISEARHAYVPKEPLRYVVLNWLGLLKVKKKRADGEIKGQGLGVQEGKEEMYGRERRKVFKE